MSDKPDLAALLGSRICHDLISPIGAIGNGVELLSLQGSDGPEVALISESVAHASARIRFFRLAYGASSGDQRVPRGEVTAILADLGRRGRLAVDWTSATDLARRDVKLILLLIQCLETVLPAGGRITVAQDGAKWRIEAAGPRLKIDPALWAVLVDPAAGPEVGASEVQFLLAAEELRRMQRRLTTDLGPAQVRLSF
ncbi:histidine phosphotransferase family protein [Neotabrizicola shimadae]|uniref:Histidine phosphotransferase n=1 Tax=Neotabrizicola shimadae TaxID=2807096 RepID=A0A8G0ZRV6_9RHOB|nr:histidine phosphotransferase family protein [Neotabrizicola shimadae]QYZ68345.1 histidine phosphotransferase [Neotabrizicola shimadae]